MILSSRNKKGFLLAEETIKIIIAAICIIFLVYILVSVYNSSTSVKKIEQAKEVLIQTDSLMISLAEGGAISQDVLNPVGWHLYTFIGEDKPNSCLGENCLCICANLLVELINSQAEKCDDKGSCILVSNLGTSDLDLKIASSTEPLFIEIKKQGGQIFIGEA